MPAYGLSPELAKKVESLLSELRKQAKPNPPAPKALLTIPKITVASEVAKQVLRQQRYRERELKKAVDQIRKEGEKLAREIAKRYGIKPPQI